MRTRLRRKGSPRADLTKQPPFSRLHGLPEGRSFLYSDMRDLGEVPHFAVPMPGGGTTRDENGVKGPARPDMKSVPTSCSGTGRRVGPAMPQGPLIEPDVRISRIRLSDSGAPSQGVCGTHMGRQREEPQPRPERVGPPLMGHATSLALPQEAPQPQPEPGAGAGEGRAAGSRP